MVDADGYGSNTLFNLGPGRLGTLLESIAVPEIRYQAVQLAAVLAEKLKEMEDEDALQMPLMDMQSTGALLEASMA